MAEKKSRAPKFLRYSLGNVPTEREGVEWMDGLGTLDFDYFPQFPYVIEESKLSLTNLPPFFRLLSDPQVSALTKWVAKGNMAKETLGLYWAADFNTDGKVKRNRLSWKVGENVRPAPPIYHTYQSCGRPMVTMPLSSKIKEVATRSAEREASDRPSKVVLLHDASESERIVEMEYEIDNLKAALKRSQAKWEGLQAQMDQVETAMTVRSELVTSAVVNYHFSKANLELLSPAIASLVDETVAPDDICQLAGGAATLDHRVKLVQEISGRLQIPIAIREELIGGEEDMPLPRCPTLNGKY